MKTLKILLLLLALVPFNNLFSQIFVEQDKIDELKNSNANSYYLPYEEAGDKLLYLAKITSFKGYYSDVKVGFDKEEYKSSDMIIVTLKRGYENKTESEEVWLPRGCDTIFSDQVEIQKPERGPHKLYLKKGQEVKINLSCIGRKSVRLNFNFGPIISYGWAGESREYIIRFSDRLKEEIFKDSEGTPENILTPRGVQKFMEMEIEGTSELVNSPGMTDSKNSFSYLEENVKEVAENNAASNHQISLFNPNDFIPVQVTISGTLLYKDPIPPHS